ncbi:hypothetical protein CBR_g21964 [Chara braunii]|uniref:DUF4360 domain-containing protein n=1 Tax=Chara braunii TaxID=69332 RepID=A0A388L1L5_CHABU|nr:hypothetical protein CBR_g21964 [Chara braunii]|eukprot:GBG76216.1 hypothetical protein CBR_g21964 [Chara braunii]
MGSGGGERVSWRLSVCLAYVLMVIVGVPTVRTAYHIRTRDFVKIQSIRYGGSGCPPGSVSGGISSRGRMFTLLMSRFVASAGPGAALADARKNCQLDIRLSFPAGWSYTVTAISYRGYGRLDPGVIGVQKTSLFFQGRFGQDRTAMTQFRGPMDNNYAIRDRALIGGGHVAWSGCGGVTARRNLEVNSEVRVNTALATSGGKSGLMAVDDVTGSFATILHLTWQRCKRHHRGGKIKGGKKSIKVSRSRPHSHHQGWRHRGEQNSSSSYYCLHSGNTSSTHPPHNHPPAHPHKCAGHVHLLHDTTDDVLPSGRTTASSSSSSSSSPLSSSVPVAMVKDESRPSPQKGIAHSGPKNVTIKKISYGGSGCPAGSVAGSISSDMAVFTLLFSGFVTSVGPHVNVRESRKNCQLDVELAVPSGWTYALVSVSYRGYVSLGKKVKGYQTTTFYFQGETGSDRSASTVFPGPYTGNYAINDRTFLGTKVYAPCGATRNLEINSQTRVDNSANDKAAGILTVDSVDGSFKTIFNLRWKKCSSS